MISWGVLSTARVALEVVVPAIVRNPKQRWVSVFGRSTDKVDVFIENIKNTQNCGAISDFRVPQRFVEVEAFLADRASEAIYVASPNSLHLEHVVKALRSGKHVLCEKPLCLTRQDADLLLTEQRIAKRLLVENYPYFLSPAYRYVNNTLQSGVLGDLKTLNVVLSFPASEKHAIRFFKEYGGGCLFDLGCYGVDLAHRLLNEPLHVKHAYSLRARDSHKAFGSSSYAPIETDLWGILWTPDDVEVTIRASFTRPRHQGVLISCTKGSVYIVDLFSIRAGTTTVVLQNTSDVTTSTFEFADPMYSLLEDFRLRLHNKGRWYEDHNRWVHNAGVLEDMQKLISPQ